MSPLAGAGRWMALSFAAALVVAVAVLALRGTEPQGVGAAVRMTARLSYLVFWPAYAAGALVELFGRTFAPLAQRRRHLGLGFAAAHLVHLGLVAWLYRISIRPPLSADMFWFFVIGAAWVYLLALLSVGRVSRALGQTGSRLLRVVGSEYIAFAFLVDFVVTPLRIGAKRPLEYLPFAILALAGPVLRLAALARGPRRAAQL